MRSSPLAVLAFVSALSLPACGLIQVTTSGGATSPGAAGGAGDGAAQPSALGDAVAKAYAGWTYQSCAANEWCGVKFAGAAGVRPDGQRGGALENPKPGMANPDAEWLPGWDKLPVDEDGARDVWEALSLAASNKSWSAECKKAYAAFKPGLDDRMKQVPEAVKAAQAEPDKYKRLGLLLSLGGRAKGEPGPKGPFVEGFDAAAFEIERAVVEGFKKDGMLFAIDAEGLGQSASTREILAPRWAESEEELAFCVRASKRGYGDLQPLPPPHAPYTDRVVALVKPVFTEVELKSIDDRIGERKATAAAALATKDASAPAHLGQLAYDDRYTVKLFKTDDKGGAQVKLHRRHDYDKSGDRCVNGLGLRVPCPVARIVVDEDVSLAFADWPAGVKLEQGDAFSVFADVAKHAVDSKGTHEQDTLEGRGLLLRSIKKKGGATTTWWK